MAKWIDSKGEPPQIRDLAIMYSQFLNEARQRAITNEILSPLGLDNNSFISRQKEMSQAFIDRVTSAMLRIEMDLAVIFAGDDNTGVHIYTVDEKGITCCDSIGFAAIGYGARHAESQFMLANHDRNSPFVDALLLTYIAKKRSEIAPGVGEDTDMFFITRELKFNWIFLREYIAALEKAYERLEADQKNIFGKSRVELREHVAELMKSLQKPQPTPPPPALPPDQSK